ncbi:MAG: hypothetical protein RIQ81_1221 [Pseudomonadota bacterium]|jgi:hypothetical protein
MKSSSNTPGAERRRHQRYHLPSGLRAGPLMTVRASDGKRMPVVNWSYGGMLLVRPGNSGGAGFLDPACASVDITMDLQLSRNYVQVATIQTVASSAETLSCAFIHNAPDALLFMRPWMECLRMGESLVELKPATMKPEMVAQGWRIWRGDGPVTLSAKSGGAPEWRLVFPDQGSYVEVGMSDGRVWQRKMVDPEERISPRMADAGTIDHRLVDSAALILAGACGSGLEDETGVPMIDSLVALRG